MQEPSSRNINDVTLTVDYGNTEQPESYVEAEEAIKSTLIQM